MPDLDHYSRFYKTKEIIQDGEITFGRWNPPPWLVKRPDAASVRTFKVQADMEGRPDKIAFVLYGTPLLDWAIIAFNDVQNPLNWPRAGTIIEYPTSAVIFPDFI